MQNTSSYYVLLLIANTGSYAFSGLQTHLRKTLHSDEVNDEEELNVGPDYLVPVPESLSDIDSDNDIVQEMEYEPLKDGYGDDLLW